MEKISNNQTQKIVTGFLLVFVLLFYGIAYILSLFFNLTIGQGYMILVIFCVILCLLFWLGYQKYQKTILFIKIRSTEIIDKLSRNYDINKDKIPTKLVNKARDTIKDYYLEIFDNINNYYNIGYSTLCFIGDISPYYFIMVDKYWYKNEYGVLEFYVKYFYFDDNLLLLFVREF